jgi:hypothetical protein
MGARNVLLYHKDLKQGTLDLSPGSGVIDAAVEALLGSHRVSLSELFAGDPESLRAASRRVRAISVRARRSAQKGAPLTVGVVWGMATWDNRRGSSTPAAPILLRRASLARRGGVGDDFELALHGAWALNPTLFHLLSVEFDIDTRDESWSDLVDDVTECANPDTLFERISKKASDVPRFAITPRVVLVTMPQVAVDATSGLAVHAPAVAGHLDANTTRIVERFRTGMLDPSKFGAETAEGRALRIYGADIVIAQVTSALRADHWPEALVEHADSGLRVRGASDLM